MRTVLRLLFRILRWVVAIPFRLHRRGAGTRRRPMPGLFTRLAQVVLFALVLLPFSGYVRGAECDRLALEQLKGLRDNAHAFLAGFIVSSRVVAVLLVVLQYALFAMTALLLALVVSRLPVFTNFLVLADYQRRRGNVFSKGAMVMGLTLPVCLALTVACHGAMSVLAWFHVSIVFGYVRFACDPARSNRTLDWAARVQGGPDDPYAAADDDGES